MIYGKNCWAATQASPDDAPGPAEVSIRIRQAGERKDRDALVAELEQLGASGGDDDGIAPDDAYDEQLSRAGHQVDRKALMSKQWDVDAKNVMAKESAQRDAAEAHFQKAAATDKALPRIREMFNALHADGGERFPYHASILERGEGHAVNELRQIANALPDSTLAPEELLEIAEGLQQQALKHYQGLNIDISVKGGSK